MLSKGFSGKTTVLGVLVLLSYHTLLGQGFTWQYSLQGSLSEDSAQGPALIPIAGATGQTGNFDTRRLPPLVCPSGTAIQGYSFPYNAGLRLNLPAGFASPFGDRDYTVQFTFKIDDMNNPSQNDISLVNLQWTFDIGLFLYNTNRPQQTASLLPFPNMAQYPQTMGPANFFDTTQFYTITIVRTNSDSMKFYVNCQLFGAIGGYFSSVPTNFNYVPGYNWILFPVANFFTFFHDSPNQSSTEAAPGFVTSISVSDFAWSDSLVQARCPFPCPTVLGDRKPPLVARETESRKPRIVFDKGKKCLTLIGPADMRGTLILINAQGKRVLTQDLANNTTMIPMPELASGTYIAVLNTGTTVSNLRFSTGGI